MKKGIVALIFLAFFSSLQAQNQWAGLWRVSRILQGQSQAESVYDVHIVPRGAELDVTIYPEDARPMTIQELEFKPTDGVLEVRASNSERQPLPMFFKFVLSGDSKIEGEWSFAHMQLAVPVTGSLQGFRVFRQAEWDPWIELENRRAKRFLDFTQLLISDAPLEQFGQFRRFWDREIERNYYFLVNKWVYGTGPQQLNHKRDRLQALYSKLGDEKYRKQMLDLTPIVERTVRTIKLLRETDDIGIFLISFPAEIPDHEELIWSRVPTRQEEAECACKLDLRERFIFVDPARFSGLTTGSVLAEREILTRSFWSGAVPPFPIQVYRESLALAYAIELQGVDWVVPAQSVAAARVEFGPLLMEHPDLLQRREELEGRLATSLSYNLGLAFVQDLRKQHSMNDLFALNQREVMQALEIFLAATS